MNKIRLILSVLIATFCLFGVGTDIEYPFNNSMFITHIIFIAIALLVLWFLPNRTHRRYAFLATGFILLLISLVIRSEANAVTKSLAYRGVEQTLPSDDIQSLMAFAERALIDSYCVAVIALIVLLLGGIITWSTNRKKVRSTTDSE